MGSPVIGLDRRGRPIHPIAGGAMPLAPQAVSFTLDGSGNLASQVLTITTPYGTLGSWRGTLTLGGAAASAGAVVTITVNGFPASHLVGIPGTSPEFAVRGSDQVTIVVTGGGAGDTLKGILQGVGSDQILSAAPNPTSSAILSGNVSADITAGTVVVEQSDPTLLLVGGAGPLLLDATSIGPIAAGGGTASVEVTMAGYGSMFFGATTQAILANPNLEISFIWLDGNGNQVLERDINDRYFNFAGSIEPVLSQSLRITVTNNNATHPQSLWLWLIGYQAPVPPGFAGLGDGTLFHDGILGIAHPTVASGSSYSLDLPAYRGPCSVHVGVGTTSYSVQVIAYDSTGTTIGVVYSNASPGETVYLSPFYLPGDACSLVYTNGGTGTQSPYLAVVAER